MPQPKSISPGKGRESLWLKVQIFRLKILSASKFHKQTFFKLGPSGKIPANYTNSAQFAHTVRELREICRFVNLFYIMFQAPSPAENSAEFQHKQSEFQKNNFIFLILAYSGSRTCLYFQISSSIKEVVISPRK